MHIDIAIGVDVGMWYRYRYRYRWRCTYPYIHPAQASTPPAQMLLGFSSNSRVARTEGRLERGMRSHDIDTSCLVITAESRVLCV